MTEQAMMQSVKLTPLVPLNTAVLFLVHKRPNTTLQVFEAIRQAKPPRLYVAADGPRADVQGEAEKVREVRDVVLNGVDWDCEVKTLFRDNNLGCKRGVSEAINWFFEHEEQGIILEDDCLPHIDFFRFCENLLLRYADDERVWVITGDNFQDGIRRGESSYYFSKYNYIWGWATWKRAWMYYQVDLPFWPEWKSSLDWQKKLPDRVERRYWAKIFDRMYANQIDTWDYPWFACVWYHGGLTATPNVNLVCNIGFGADSTHTTQVDSPLANITANTIGEITHQERIEQNSEADRYVFDEVFGGKKRRWPRSVLRLPRRIAKIYRGLKLKIINI